MPYLTSAGIEGGAGFGGGELQAQLQFSSTQHNLAMLYVQCLDHATPLCMSLCLCRHLHQQPKPEMPHLTSAGIAGLGGGELQAQLLISSTQHNLALLCVQCWDHATPLCMCLCLCEHLHQQPKPEMPHLTSAGIEGGAGFGGGEL